MQDKLGTPAAAVLLLLGLALGAGTLSAESPATGVLTMPGTKAETPAHTAAECDDLLKQFDVAWPTHREHAGAEEARESRERGMALCAAGNYADGVREVRHALHAIGVKPVKIAVATRG